MTNKKISKIDHLRNLENLDIIKCTQYGMLVFRARAAEFKFLEYLKSLKKQITKKLNVLSCFKKQQVLQLNILLSSTGSFISVKIHRLLMSQNILDRISVLKL